MLWMAVTPDKYELPVCVEESCEDLARTLRVNSVAIHKQIKRRKEGRTTDTNGGRGGKQLYRYYKVEDYEEDK